MSYTVPDDKKVTAGKILSMRSHWHKAAISAIEEHVKTVHEGKRNRLAKELFKLRTTYQQEIAAAQQDPYPVDDENKKPLTEYVPSSDYGDYFGLGLPASLAREIKEAYDADTQNLVPLDEANVKKQMAIAFIRAANQDKDSWTA